ncbi:Uncharacterised protein [Mycobacteroides abscessus subsp. abscessus]|nr:Uncharacterised protein [Mycobacteroides abscessus subsp. abscessus]
MVGRAKCADLVTFVEDALPAALQLVAKPLQLRRTLTGQRGTITYLDGNLLAVLDDEDDVRADQRAQAPGRFCVHIRDMDGLGEHLIDIAAQDLPEEFLLGPDMVVERATAHACRRTDLGYARGVKSLLRKQICRYLHDPLTGRRGVAIGGRWAAPARLGSGLCHRMPPSRRIVVPVQ